MNFEPQCGFGNTVEANPAEFFRDQSAGHDMNAPGPIPLLEYLAWLDGHVSNQNTTNFHSCSRCISHPFHDARPVCELDSTKPVCKDEKCRYSEVEFLCTMNVSISSIVFALHCDFCLLVPP
jgi:hypothetical protein